MDKAKVEEIVKELHRINFGEILGKENPEEYNYTRYKNNDYKHEKNVNECCLLCGDDSNFNCDQWNKRIISHGTHSFDYIEVFKKFEPNIDISDWNYNPVVFLFENPSRDKEAAKHWYWIQEGYQRDKDSPHFMFDKDSVKEENIYKKGKYNEMLASIIYHYKLANAYVTNAVKCGFQKNNGDFMKTKEYSKKCIDNCLYKILYKELECITSQFKDKVTIICFGRAAEKLVLRFLKNWERKNDEEKNNDKPIYVYHPAAPVSAEKRRQVMDNMLEELKK